jgi:hypothetical protein
MNNSNYQPTLEEAKIINDKGYLELLNNTLECIELENKAIKEMLKYGGLKSSLAHSLKNVKRLEKLRNSMIKDIFGKI